MNRRTLVVLQLTILSASLTGHAIVKNTMRITVLEEETHAAYVNDKGVPKNCDFANYDAYCHNSWTTIVSNVLLVQEDQGEPYKVTCTVETKWSHCKPLLSGYSFDAQREKHGLLIYYLDERGKLRKQLYTYVSGQETEPAETRPARTKSGNPANTDGQIPPASPGESELQRPAKCSFTSTPAGADIQVDGKFVGSTPSVLSLSSGDHAVLISTTGFAEWKRKLTVSSGSELTVNAVLEKQ